MDGVCVPSLFAGKIFGGVAQVTWRVIDPRDFVRVGRETEVQATEITGRVDVDALSHVPVLEHGAIAEDMVPLGRVVGRDFAEPVGAVLLFGRALVGLGIAHGLDAFQQPVRDDLLIRHDIPTGRVNHRVAQQVLGRSVVQTGGQSEFRPARAR